MHLWYFYIFADIAVDELSFDGRIADNRHPYPDIFQISIKRPECMNYVIKNCCRSVNGR